MGGEKIRAIRQRKANRLTNYDYSSNGAYFLTICTYGRVRLFGDITGDKTVLNDAGIMIQQKILEMPEFYPDINVDAFCVMPNHVHAIFKICENNYPGSGTPQGAFPTMGLPDYVDRFKTLTTKLYIDGVHAQKYRPFEFHVWQKSYYDHIIKNDVEYRSIVNYIRLNPQKWNEDEYYNSNL
jgi:putative transposase